MRMQTFENINVLNRMLRLTAASRHCISQTNATSLSSLLYTQQRGRGFTEVDRAGGRNQAHRFEELIRWYMRLKPWREEIATLKRRLKRHKAGFDCLLNPIFISNHAPLFEFIENKPIIMIWDHAYKKLASHYLSWRSELTSIYITEYVDHYDTDAQSIEPAFNNPNELKEMRSVNALKNLDIF
ncbi:hypothetical protein ACTXT7_003245 [Hymenolepis weldensis]